MEQPYKDEIIEFAQQLIKIPTVNPPGEYYSECVSLLEEKCTQLGLKTAIVECDGLPSIVGGNGKGILHFHGHYDVVQAEKFQFDPYVKNGILYGRGSSDMKGGLAAMIYALHVIDSPDVTFSITPDEETGGIHGVYCLLKESVIAPKAVLMPEVSSNKIWNACRGAFALDITVRGKSAHSVYQHLGANAFEEMLDVASAFRDVAPGEGTLLLGGAVTGGTQFNMVPEACSFTIDWRFPPDQTLSDVKETALTIVETMKEKGKTLETDILLETDGFHTPETEKICEVVEKAVQEVRGASEFELCPGFLDIRHFAHRGIPAVAYGPGLLEVAHGPQEHVNINDVLDAFAVYVSVGRRMLDSSQ